MNRRIKKAWRMFLASNSTVDWCRLLYYHNQQVIRTGEIDRLAVTLPD